MFYKIKNDKWCLLTILTNEIIEKIILQRLRVQRLTIDLMRENPIFLEIDDWVEEEIGALKKKYNVLSIEDRTI
ncbi:hypothetical protein CN971_23795 [Bacillus thuringiensis]|uniref:Uncharacterized protein n=1 Tax=Bacillus thuringiensis TaxID=1428 RepID=A0A9X7BNE8_BACTU|nr:hypothetical protein [Bacillus thuringiensis]MED4446258.1 hypothetical protein [Bacillus cereus]PEB43986.1 hypothetical protein COM82_30585 [Bacillus thuringiensis]PED27103.1 hypothetical protein CON34_06925 [Bacillus thuringiensis]PFV29628.1 hypothetical protein COK99_17225 [Bacillus thuringiensis]PGN17781.1 hypothetical protein CN969_27115 [Bacillus thuringiensis]